MGSGSVDDHNVLSAQSSGTIGRSAITRKNIPDTFRYLRLLVGLVLHIANRNAGLVGSFRTTNTGAS